MRINAIPAKYLTDEHLIAEWNEHHMLPPMMEKSFGARGMEWEIWEKLIPLEYTLNKGHAFFFYNKLVWVNARRQLIFDEMRIRGFMPNKAFMKLKVLEGWPLWIWGQWEPCYNDMLVSIRRIEDRIQKKPAYYSCRGRSICTSVGERDDRGVLRVKHDRAAQFMKSVREALELPLEDE